jgi:hypothetical protein
MHCLSRSWRMAVLMYDRHFLSSKSGSVRMTISPSIHCPAITSRPVVVLRESTRGLTCLMNLTSDSYVSRPFISRVSQQAFSLVTATC